VVFRIIARRALKPSCSLYEFYNEFLFCQCKILSFAFAAFLMQIQNKDNVNDNGNGNRWSNHVTCTLGLLSAFFYPLYPHMYVHSNSLCVDPGAHYVPISV